MRGRLVGSVALLVAALGLGVAACSSDGSGGKSGTTVAGKSESPFDAQFVGAIEASKAKIAVVTLKDGQASAYLCDSARLGRLVAGTIGDDGALDLAPAGGVEVTGTLKGDTVTGTVTLDGAKHSFTAEPPTGVAGFYRASQEVDGERVVGGWVVLSDGSQVGAVRKGGTIVANPVIDPAAGVVTVEGTQVKTFRVNTIPGTSPAPWINPDPLPWINPDTQP